MYSVPGRTGQVAPASRKLQAFSYPAGIESGKGIPKTEALSSTMRELKVWAGLTAARPVKTCPRRSVQRVAVQSFDSNHSGIGTPPGQALMFTRTAEAAAMTARTRKALKNMVDWRIEQNKLRSSRTRSRLLLRPRKPARWFMAGD